MEEEADVKAQAQQSARRMAAVAAHPISELLECPPQTSALLSAATECLHLLAGEVVFRQGAACRGLYVVAAGEFQRKAERRNTRLNLGPARSGDLVELSAALSEEAHTYTLSAIGAGTLLLLPIDALRSAFAEYPPLRMRLLQELAREVSRAYLTCCLSRVTPAHRRRNGRV